MNHTSAKGQTLQSSSIRQHVMCAFFTAVMAVFSQIIIPIQPVPISMGSMAALMAGAILGKKYGALSMILYILLGAVGLPVFAAARSGLPVIFGPGGGFIAGYVLMAFFVGWIAEKYGYRLQVMIPAMAGGTLICYACGLAWFMVLTKTGLWAALTMCVFPFIIGDIVKVCLGAVLVNRYKKYVF